MSSEYERALRALYQGPRESFVAERQRLASELKAAGDRESAARLAKLPRPTLSAWVVNQLWWHSPEAFQHLFETARALRAGKLNQAADHRKAVAELNARAQALLRQQGHGNGDAVSRRVMMTLSALAASGGFEPDVPGTLSLDRDPPGFEAFGIDSAAVSEPKTPRGPPAAAQRHPPSETRSEPRDAQPARKTTHHGHADAKQVREAAKEEARRTRAEAQEAARRARAEAEETARRERAEALAREREAAERAKRLAERRRLQHALADLEKQLSRREAERSRLQEALSVAEHERDQALARVTAARAGLAELGEDD